MRCFGARGALSTAFAFDHEEGSKKGPTGMDSETASTGPGPSYASSVTNQGIGSPSATPETVPGEVEEDVEVGEGSPPLTQQSLPSPSRRRL
jgi:hypothetical protein